MSENWTIKQALEEMISLWDRVHPGVILGRPTLHAAKRALAENSAPPTYAQGQEEMRERAAKYANIHFGLQASQDIRALPIKEGE